MRRDDEAATLAARQHVGWGDSGWQARRRRAGRREHHASAAGTEIAASLAAKNGIYIGWACNIQQPKQCQKQSNPVRAPVLRLWRWPSLLRLRMKRRSARR